MGHAVINIMKPNDFFEEVELQLSDDIIDRFFEGDISNTRFFKPKKVGMVCNNICFNLDPTYPLIGLSMATKLISDDPEYLGIDIIEMPYYQLPLTRLSAKLQEITHKVFTDNTYIVIRAYDGAVIPENLEAWLLIDTNISYYHK